QDDIRSARSNFLGDVVRRKMQSLGENWKERVRILDQCGIRYHRRNRHVLGENLVARIINCSAFRWDDVATDMLFRGFFAVVIVLDDLEIDQAPGKEAKEEGKEYADYDAARAASPLHCPLLSLATGRRSSSPAGRSGKFSLTMLCSAIGIILR